MDTSEFRCVWDADWLVNLREEYPDAGCDERKQIIEKVFRTGAGKRRAGGLYLQGE